MTLCPFRHAKPEWRSDSLEFPEPPLVEEVSFDRDREAWIFSRYADVVAALRSPLLVMTGLRPTDAPAEPLDLEAHLRMLEETRRALSSASLRQWNDVVRNTAERLVEQFSSGAVIDLVADYAEPLCLALAVEATNAPREKAMELAELAKTISYSTSDPADRALKERSHAAQGELEKHFQQGPVPLREGGFVGLTQTLVGLLANIWLALLQQPAAWESLRSEPELASRAMEELMRYAGVTRVVMRRAVEDVVLNGHLIRAGERIVLRLSAANHDPERFADPERIDFDRADQGHLALGAGIHVCAGGPLLRATLVSATQVLMERFERVELAGPVEWRGGMIFRAPARLLVRGRQELAISD